MQCISPSFQVYYIAHMPQYAWERLASTISPDFIVDAFISGTLRACATNAAYIEDHAFRQLLEYPLRLAVGDIEENLKELTEADAVIECTTTRRIRYLLRSGMINRKMLVKVIAQWLELSFTAIVIEQDHAMIARISRWHPLYGIFMQAMRGAICQIACLLKPTKPERRLAMLENRLEKLLRRRPQNNSGQGIYMSDMMCHKTVHARSSEGRVPSCSQADGGHALTIVLRHG